MAVASVSHATGSQGRCRTLTHPPDELPPADCLVLLLDRDDEFRTALAEMLREDGYNVLAYARPADVPPAGRLERVTTLVTDSHPPGNDGLVFGERFHAKYPDAAIIVTASYSTPLLEAQVAEFPYMRLLWKPIEYTTLIGLFRSSNSQS